MKRFVQGQSRAQTTLLPECLDDYVAEDNPARVIDAFIDQLDLGQLGFESVEPAATGRPGYHPAVLLKIYLYGYLNRVKKGARLELFPCLDAEAVCVSRFRNSHRRHSNLARMALT
jgi:transposase